MKKSNIIRYVGSFFGILMLICFFCVFISWALFPNIEIGGMKLSAPALLIVLTFVFAGINFLTRGNLWGLFIIAFFLILGYFAMMGAGGRTELASSGFSNPTVLEADVPAGKALLLRLDYTATKRRPESKVRVTTTYPDGRVETNSFMVGDITFDGDGVLYSYDEMRVVDKSVEGHYVINIEEIEREVTINKATLYSKDL